MMTYMGVDPGKSGAIAFLKHDFSKIAVHVMPLIGKDIDGDQIRAWIKMYNPIGCTIEKAQAFPKDGASRAFTYGVGFGTVCEAIKGARIPYVLVRPQAWKKDVLAGTKKDKDAAIDFICRRFPGVDLRATERCTKKHDGKADAGCIAVHAVRTWHTMGEQENGDL